MTDSRHIFNTQNDGNQWTPRFEISIADFLALPDEEIRTMFPNAGQVFADLGEARLQRGAEVQQEGA